MWWTTSFYRDPGNKQNSSLSRRNNNKWSSLISSASTPVSYLSSCSISRNHPHSAPTGRWADKVFCCLLNPISVGVLPLSCQLNVVKQASEDCPSQAEPGFPHHLFTPNTVEPFVSTRVRIVRAQTKRWCRQCGRNKSGSFVLWLWVKEGVNNTGDRFINGTLHWIFTVDINKRDWRSTQTEHSI